MSEAPALTGPEATASLREAAARRGLELKVASGSMRPWLAPGDVVTIAPASARELRLGEIVAVAAPGGIVVHRYLGTCGQGRALLLRGDALAACDEPHPVDRLVGRVTCVQSVRTGHPRAAMMHTMARRGLHACLGALSQALCLSGWLARSMLAAARGRRAPARPGLPSRALQGR